MKCILSVVLPALFLAAPAAAQTPEEELEAMKSLFPGEDYVFTKYFASLTLTVDDNELQANHITEEESMILNDRATRYSEGSTRVSSFSELVDLDVRTRIPSGNKYKNIKVKEFTEYDLSSGNIFYDDDKTMKYSYPQLQVGAKKYERVEKSITDPHFIPSFYPAAFIPTKDGRFELKVEEGIEVEITPLNFDTFQVTHRVESKGKYTTYIWEYQDYKAQEYESTGVDVRQFVPHILIRVKQFEHDDGQRSVLRDIGDLHAWYCDFVTKSSEEPSAEIQAIVDSITADAANEEEGAKRIYQWVQKHIEYVAIEDGYRGYQPEFASKVCANRFGDCKGMSNLLKAMYDSFGLYSQLTWVGTRDIYYTYDEVPTPSVDNHMILTLFLDGKKYFLDATNSKLEFGQPSSFIQGKQTLINHDCDSFELAYVPIRPATDNMVVDSIELEVADRSLKGKGKMVLTGYSRMYFESGIGRSDYGHLLDYGRDYLSRGSNKFILDTIWLEQSEDHNLPLVVNYNFTIQDYAVAAGNEKYINLNIEPGDKPEVVKDDRRFPLSIQFKTQYRSWMSLKLSDGDQVAELPENHEIEYPMHSYKLSYAKDAGRVIRTSEETYNFLNLEKDGFEDFNDYVKRYLRSQRESLVIQQP